jgi:Arc/MetJ-type ribon-helix-helix transcriptional regulator
MTITLTPEQIKWLATEVAAGRFVSIEDGVRSAVAELMQPRIELEDDLTWTQPLVDEAVAEIDQGKGIAWDDAKKSLDAQLKARGIR